MGLYSKERQRIRRAKIFAAIPGGMVKSELRDTGADEVHRKAGFK